MGSLHEIPAERTHTVWDNAIAPVLEVDSGDTVELAVTDASGGQLDRDSGIEAVAALDFSRVNPVTGPVFVKGAQPGDVLEVEILSLRPRDWGWTAIIPGFGLLADEFPDPYLRVFDISNGDVVRFGEGIEIPLTPFMGTMGVCPAGASAQPVMPPGTFGGNMDTRQLVAGTTLYLPVQVEGALFSCGDAHGCQGDGEVCVTGLEAPMYGALRFSVQSGRSIPGPQFQTSGPLTPSVDFGGWYGTTGVGGDLYKASQDAIRAMIAHLGERHGLSGEDAYLLCSLCVDLKISEIVDAGEYVVSALLPDAVFVG
jgi:acetamidase/formamidase